MTSRDLRQRAFAVLSALAIGGAGACANGNGSSPPVLSPTPDRPPSQAGGGSPMLQPIWPVRTREHVDLWLHSYALLTTDSALVPYFQRGYHDRMLVLRHQRNVTTALDANRARLVERIRVQPSLATGPQFLPLYFASWDQMRQAIDLFIRANGNPRAVSDPALQQYFGILGASFQSAADREWLRLFTESVDDESRKFYHSYWITETAARALVVAHVDSLWERQWRPQLQRYLNNTQQQNGELYLSFPLGGEGRTVQFAKTQNAVAVGVPGTSQDAPYVLYTFAHEIAGSLATTAIEDNTTPAERRSGATAGFEQSAAVRAGALLLERTLPSAVQGYMRYYLVVAGRTAPRDIRAEFESTFSVPPAVVGAISRQIDVILGGI